MKISKLDDKKYLCDLSECDDELLCLLLEDELLLCCLSGMGGKKRLLVNSSSIFSDDAQFRFLSLGVVTVAITLCVCWQAAKLEPSAASTSVVKL